MPARDPMMFLGRATEVDSYSISSVPVRVYFFFLAEVDIVDTVLFGALVIPTKKSKYKKQF